MRVELFPWNNDYTGFIVKWKLTPIMDRKCGLKDALSFGMYVRRDNALDRFCSKVSYFRKNQQLSIE